MDEMKSIVGCQFYSLIKREFDWVLVLSNNVSIAIYCLWRLLENGCIRFTSEDEGQWFGLPSPVDNVLELSQRLAGSTVDSVPLKEGTLDMELHFSSGHILQVIPNSSGYESWEASIHNLSIIACGGGKLAVIGSNIQQ